MTVLPRTLAVVRIPTLWTVQRALAESAGTISTSSGTWDLHLPRTLDGIHEGVHFLAEPGIVAASRTQAQDTCVGESGDPWWAGSDLFSAGVDQIWGKYDAAWFSAVYVDAIAFSTELEWNDDVCAGLVDWCTSFLSQLALQTQQSLVSVISGVPSRNVKIRVLDTTEGTITEWSPPRGNADHAVTPRCAFGNLVIGALDVADNGFRLRAGHQFLLSAYTALHDGDWRRVFIDLGSALDIAAADVLRALRAAGMVGGSTKKVELLGNKLTLLESSGHLDAGLHRQLLNNVVYPRNTAVHDGTSPSPEASKQAVLTTEEAFRDVFSPALGAFLP